VSAEPAAKPARPRAKRGAKKVAAVRSENGATPPDAPAKSPAAKKGAAAKKPRAKKVAVATEDA
jgi:hypothetical protein